MNTPQHDPGQPARKITLLESLQTMHDSRFAAELQQAHREVTEHMMNKGGKGRITIVLDYMKTDDKGITVAPDLAIKLPKKVRRGTFLYADDRGQTYIDDPTEPELPFPGSKLSVVPAKAAGQ